MNPLQQNLIISAVLPNPAGTDSKAEWLEVFNNSSAALNLAEFQMKTNSGNYQALSSEARIIPRHSFYYLLANLESRPPNVSMEQSTKLNFSLLNSPASIFLKAANAPEPIQEFKYKNTADDLVTRLINTCQSVENVAINNFQFNNLTALICPDSFPLPGIFKQSEAAVAVSISTKTPQLNQDRAAQEFYRRLNQDYLTPHHYLDRVNYKQAETRMELQIDGNESSMINFMQSQTSMTTLNSGVMSWGQISYLACTCVLAILLVTEIKRTYYPVLLKLLKKVPVPGRKHRLNLE